MINSGGGLEETAVRLLEGGVLGTFANSNRSVDQKLVAEISEISITDECPTVRD